MRPHVTLLVVLAGGLLARAPMPQVDFADAVIDEEARAGRDASAADAPRHRHLGSIDDVIDEELAAAPPQAAPTAPHHLPGVDEVMAEEEIKRPFQRFRRGAPESFKHSWVMHYSKAKRRSSGVSRFVE